MPRYLMSIDQGTTSSRAIIFDENAQLITLHQMELTQSYPYAGWVEQSPEEMVSNTIQCCREALKKANLYAKDIVAIGITNQRETTILWDKHTGKSIYPAIVWQDRRTVDICKRVEFQAFLSKLQFKTGLLLDPYFSATKIIWLLENIPDLQKRIEKNEIAFGTVDSFLLWHLTGGKMHATDATNASRTMLFNIHTQQWDSEILNLFNIPQNILPNVLDSAADFGETDLTIFDTSIPIKAIIGDQQSATVGQACFSEGMVKATYGTGCFVLMNTGNVPLQSQNRLLTTVAYRISGVTTYGLEGSIFSAGITVKWLRDVLKVISSASEADKMAASIEDNGGVYFVPAFTGLGAPYWDSYARGNVSGLTLQNNLKHIVRAALESVCYQTRDLLECMQLDGIKKIEVLRVDGGMAVSDWVLQFLADILNTTIQRPCCVETTALGAAFLAGFQSGLYKSLDEISMLWQANESFYSNLDEVKRVDLYQGWKKAIARVIMH